MCFMVFGRAVRRLARVLTGWPRTSATKHMLWALAHDLVIFIFPHPPLTPPPPPARPAQALGHVGSHDTEVVCQGAGAAHPRKP